MDGPRSPEPGRALSELLRLWREMYPAGSCSLRIRRGRHAGTGGEIPLPEGRGSQGISIALGGGGVRGFAHLGLLKVLREEGIPVEAIAGTSAGALAACVFAFGLPLRPEPVLEALSDLGHLLARGGALTRWRRFLTISRRLALVDGEVLVIALLSLFGERRLEESDIPVAVVAADLCSGEVVALREGPVARAVAYSCAIPGIFPPFEHEGRLLVDGAVVEKVPVSVARSLGGGAAVVGVDVSNPAPPAAAPRTGIEAAVMAGDASRRRLTEISLEDADLSIRLPFERRVERFELEEAQRLYRLGTEVGEKALPRIRALAANGVRTGR